VAPRRSRLAGAFVVLGLALTLASCGGHTARQLTRPIVRRTTIDIYASLPLHGIWAAQGTSLLNGVKLALAQARHRAGTWRVHLVAFDDSAGAAKVAQDARVASTDPAAVYYIGELDSAASQISAPILNAAGLPQVSPLSTDLSGPGRTLDPTGRPSFLRLAPSDGVQAAAQLGELAHRGCRRVAVVHDDTLEGTGLASLIQAKRGQYGVRIARVEPLTDPVPLAARLKAQGDDCIVYAGAATAEAATLLGDVLPGRVRLLLGSYGVCTEPFAALLPLAARAVFRCTLPLGNLAASAAGRGFLTAYRTAYGGVFDPLAAYGYEAMRLGLDLIAALGGSGDDKSAVRSALFALRTRTSMLGTYGFTRTGSSTLKAYGVYRVGASGEPVFAGR
jgi:branched-chain amino acid transport system substrate-binding protein